MENIYKRTTITNNILSSVSIHKSHVSKLSPHIFKKSCSFLNIPDTAYTNTYLPTFVWQDFIAEYDTSWVKGVLLIKI